MKPKSQIILVGGGGHCRSVIDVIETTGLFEISGILDTKDKLGSSVYGYKIIATDDDIEKLVRENLYLFVTVGQIKSAKIRKRLYETIVKSGGRPPVIISPYAHISKRAEIGPGSIVMHHAMINTSAFIGANCIINSGAIIEHDTSIGDHCHISTGALLNGGVKVREGVFVGSGAIVNQGITIAENNIIASGTLVNKDTFANRLYAGVPAKMKEK